ncbi:hypothetical protein [Candidatus Methylomirabilis sp.]|uniref:hypothetical protein n=1 Tax=Candidatus Methylomirabilis sp. TaxID=2032687 RepID=UPI002A5C23EE|nr:hypothetical protein [Candidatus Methylomirabilis sp.]
MKPKATPARGQRSGRTPQRRERSTAAEPSMDVGTEAERPLDAEDVALASLDAKVRTEEARADLSSIEPHADLSVRLPRAVISRLLAEADQCNITPSELIKRALMQYLPMQKGGGRR